jgi:DNA-binding PadR family transcriptional regulator
MRRCQVERQRQAVLDELAKATGKHGSIVGQLQELQQSNTAEATRREQQMALVNDVVSQLESGQAVLLEESKAWQERQRQLAIERTLRRVLFRL